MIPPLLVAIALSTAHATAPSPASDSHAPPPAEADPDPAPPPAEADPDPAPPPVDPDPAPPPVEADPDPAPPPVEGGPAPATATAPAPTPAPAATAPAATAPPPAGWRAADDAAPPRDEDGGNGATIAFGAAYGAYTGATSAWLIGEALEDHEQDHTSEGVALGGLGGALTGATLGHLLSRPGRTTPQGVALLYNSTALGWYYGEELGRLLIPPAAPGAFERIRASGMAGSMAGIGLGIAFSDRASPIGEQLHYTAATGVGWVTGHGIGDMADWDRVTDRRARAGVELGASAALGGVALAANRLGMEPPNAAAITLGLVDGAWYGAWSPYLFTDTPEPSQVAGGLQVGAGVGYTSAVMMAALGQPSPRSAALQGVGLAAGSALGAGLPLSLGAEGPSQAVVGSMLATGAAGQALGGLLAPRYEVEPEDAVLLATLEGWTAYQAIGWSVFGRAFGATETEAVGLALTAGGAGTLLTMGMAPALDVAPEGSVMLLSGGAWGTWFGAWGSQIAGADADGLWLASLTAGNGTLLASAVAQGAGWHPTWQQAALINGGGLVGAAAGGLLGAIALYDPDDWTPVSASVVAGSGAGLVLGSVVSTRPATAQRRERTARSGGLPSFAASLPFTARAQVLPWAAEGSDQPGVWVQLDLHER